MSYLLIESIFKIKQDCDLPSYYGNCVLYKVLRSVEHFSLLFFGCEGQLHMSESTAGLRLLEVLMRIHLFVMSTF